MIVGRPDNKIGNASYTVGKVSIIEALIGLVAGTLSMMGVGK